MGLNLKQILDYNKLLCRRNAELQERLAECLATPECPECEDCPDLPTDCDSCCFTVIRDFNVTAFFRVTIQTFNGSTWDTIGVLDEVDGSHMQQFCNVIEDQTGTDIRIILQGFGDFDGIITGVLVNSQTLSDLATDLGEGQFAVTLDQLGGVCFNNILFELQLDPPLRSTVYFAGCIGGSTLDSMDVFDVDNNLIQHEALDLLADDTDSKQITLLHTDLIDKIVFNTSILTSTDTFISTCLTTSAGYCKAQVDNGNPINSITLTGLTLGEDAIVTMRLTCGEPCVCDP